MGEPQTTQLLLHGVIDARIVAADLSVTSDGQLQPTKKVALLYILFFLFRENRKLYISRSSVLEGVWSFFFRENYILYKGRGPPYQH